MLELWSRFARSDSLERRVASSIARGIYWSRFQNHVHENKETFLFKTWWFPGVPGGSQEAPSKTSGAVVALFIFLAVPYNWLIFPDTGETDEATCNRL